MNDVKSILINLETHDDMKKFAKESGMKIKFIAEQAIKEYIEKRSVSNGDTRSSEQDV